MVRAKKLFVLLLFSCLMGISCSDSGTGSGDENQKLEHKFFDSQSTSTFNITKTVDGQVLSPSETPEFEEAVAFVNLDESKKNIDGESYTGITFFLAPEGYSGNINLVDDVKSPGLLAIKINDKQGPGQLTSQEEYLTLYRLANIDLGSFEATAYDSQVGAPTR
ncbi:MAG: hypothetical protein U5J95_12560 [Balneolaceae bacterium]|nr:hypothetical protein [Balneolaceae bacterium]